AGADLGGDAGGDGALAGLGDFLADVRSIEAKTVAERDRVHALLDADAHGRRIFCDEAPVGVEVEDIATSRPTDPAVARPERRREFVLEDGLHRLVPDDPTHGATFGTARLPLSLRLRYVARRSVAAAAHRASSGGPGRGQARLVTELVHR